MSAGDAPRLVGVGGIFIDDIVLPSGQTYMAQLGGGVIHALMGMVVWGERPGLVAPMGEGFPPESAERLQRSLDMRGVYHLPIPQIRAWQLFEEDGSRREMYRVRETAPFIQGPQPTDLPECYQQSDGYYLIQDFEGIERWCSTLKGFVLWEPLQQIMTRENREKMRQTLAACTPDLVSPNLMEAQAVYGVDDPDRLIDALFEDGVPKVALRMGEAGSLLADRETGYRVHVPPVPVETIVDQTGAGNTYCGALLWGVMNGYDLRHAGAAGAVAASFCLEGVGVVDPTRVLPAERDRRLRALLG